MGWYTKKREKNFSATGPRLTEPLSGWLNRVRKARNPLHSLQRHGNQQDSALPQQDYGHVTMGQGQLIQEQGQITQG